MPVQIDFSKIGLKAIDFKDKKIQTILLVVLAALSVFILYLSFVFFPQVLRVTAIVKKSMQINAELKSARSMISRKDELQKKLDEYKQEVELYEKKLPAEQEIPNLLEDLSSMAKKSNIKIISIVPAPPYFKEQKIKKSSVYQEIPILITANSGYHELGRFLGDLENADRFMKVVDISIKADRPAPQNHAVELVVCTYISLSES